MHTLSRPFVSDRPLLTWIGRVGFACQFRRPAWSWLETFFLFAARAGRGRSWTSAAANEVLSLICILPYLFFELRVSFGDRIAATDASPIGEASATTPVPPAHLPSKPRSRRTSTQTGLRPVVDLLH